MNPFFYTAVILAGGAASGAYAGNDVITIEMKDGRFNPPSLSIPTDKKVELKVTNHESREVEFESYELDREVKIAPNETTSIFVGPLASGTYPIFDDNNQAAKGEIVAVGK